METSWTSKDLKAVEPLNARDSFLLSVKKCVFTYPYITSMHYCTSYRT